jgi:hypothetical protein
MLAGEPYLPPRSREGVSIQPLFGAPRVGHRSALAVPTAVPGADCRRRTLLEGLRRHPSPSALPCGHTAALRAPNAVPPPLVSRGVDIEARLPRRVPRALSRHRFRAHSDVREARADRIL